MSELENIKPVAFYRADWKGDIMFRKDNTVVIRKNEGDFTTGWIKPLYDELPEPQPQLTIPKSIADILDNIFNSFTELQNNANSLMIQTIYTHYEPETTFYKWFNKEDNSYNISIIYLAGKALGVDLVKVGEG